MFNKKNILVMMINTFFFFVQVSIMSLEKLTVFYLKIVQIIIF